MLLWECVDVEYGEESVWENNCTNRQSQPSRKPAASSTHQSTRVFKIPVNWPLNWLRSRNIMTPVRVGNVTRGTNPRWMLLRKLSRRIWLVRVFWRNKCCLWCIVSESYEHCQCGKNDYLKTWSDGSAQRVLVLFCLGLWFFVTVLPPFVGCIPIKPLSSSSLSYSSIRLNWSSFSILRGHDRVVPWHVLAPGNLWTEKRCESVRQVSNLPMAAPLRFLTATCHS